MTGPVDHFRPAVVPVGPPAPPDVYVRTVNALEMIRAAELFRAGADDVAGVGLCLLCACDAEGVRLFGDDEADRVAAAPGFLVSAVALKAAEINGLAADVEALEGNSEAGQ